MTGSDPQAPERLLAGFPVPDTGAWRAEVERLLKGAPYARAMVTRTLEGLEIPPLATATDTADLPWPASLPGEAPFVRGARAGGYHAAPWLVAQEIALPDGAGYNAALRRGLQRGQTAVNLVLDRAGRMSADPACAEPDAVGSGGLSLADLADLETVLGGVDPAATPILLESGAAALPAAALLVAWVRARGGDPALLQGCAGCDPLAGLAEEGRLPVALDALYDQLAGLTRWAGEHAPGLRTLPVHEAPWHEGGADGVLSLGLTLGAAVETLRALEQRGLDPAAAVPRVQFNLRLGGDFFLEIARLRALRLLWSRIQEASGLAPVPAFIHVRTGRRNLARLDPHVNLLRATTASMAAVLGGTDSLHVSPFDEPLGATDAFSRRLARNLHLILAHECHLDHVADPAGGAWYPEHLTGQVARRAWERFQEIEAGGGVLAGLRSGAIQDAVAEVAAERARRLATRRDVMVGVNQYAPAGEEPIRGRPFPGADFAAVRRRETAGRGGAVPGSADLEDLVTAAAAGATLSGLQPAGPDDLTVRPIPGRRDAAPFEALRARIAALDEERDRTVFCACLGDFARYMPRLDFVRRFFQTGGFTVRAEEHFPHPEAAAAAAAAAAAGTVVLVGLDETYAGQAPAAARRMRAIDPPPRVILAGRSGDLEAGWREAGIDEFIHLRSDVLAVLGRLAGAGEGAS